MFVREQYYCPGTVSDSVRWLRLSVCGLYRLRQE